MARFGRGQSFPPLIQRFVIAAEGVSGELTQPLDALTLVSDGAVEISGVAATTLGALTSVATGTVDVLGTSSPTLGALTLVSAGGVEVQGTSAPTLAALTLSSAGGVEVQGASAPTLDAVTVEAEGVVGSPPIEGEFIQTLGALTLSSAGTVDVVGALSQALNAATIAATGGVEVRGDAAVTLAPLTLTAAGTADIAGTVAATLGALTSAATGTVAVAGVLSQTLGAVVLGGEGVVGDPPNEGVLIGTLGTLTVVSAGLAEISGVASPTLAAVTLVSTITTQIQGVADVTLGPVTLDEPSSGDVLVAGVLGSYASLVVADGASHYWALDDTDGFFAQDSVTGDIAYRLIVQTFPAGVAFQQPGLIHERLAAQFDGADRLAMNQAINPPGSSAFSMEVWFQPSSVDVSGGRIVVVSTNNDTKIFMTATTIGAKVIHGGIEHSFDIATVPVVGALYHLVVTYQDGVGLSGYLNGVYKGTGPGSGTITVGSRFVVGGSEAFGETSFQGVIDELAVYPLALTVEQVQRHYAAGGTYPVLPSLTAVITGGVDVQGSLVAMLEALYVIPEVAYQPFAHPGERYLAQFGATRTSTTLTASDADTELVSSGTYAE